MINSVRGQVITGERFDSEEPPRVNDVEFDHVGVGHIEANEISAVVDEQIANGLAIIQFLCRQLAALYLGAMKNIGSMIFARKTQILPDWHSTGE